MLNMHNFTKDISGLLHNMVFNKNLILNRILNFSFLFIIFLLLNTYTFSQTLWDGLTVSTNSGDIANCEKQRLNQERRIL
ncbi:MAG: hypothetical protein A2046_14555 [Bacteroidetes bacterium GWA2_30_7]|nr:MAG: hypothetical protein A2046_14555 [Bacteroidetes bacterium GWA2_30_7]